MNIKHIVIILMDDPASIWAKVADGLYVGNRMAAQDWTLLPHISLIINLTGRADPAIEDVDIFDFALPSQELLPDEFAKTTAKLTTIAVDISAARQNGHSVLIHCADGKNKCMLVAGFYLISCGENCNQVIERLEAIYFTAAQKREEAEDQQRCGYGDDDPAQLTPAEQSAMAEQWKQREILREARREVRCLTMASFRKLLRLSGGEKK